MWKHRAGSAERRGQAPRLVGDVLQRIRPREARLSSLRMVFEAVVGPTLAAESRVTELAGTRLVVAVRTESALADLRSHERFLLATIAERVDGVAVRSVDYRVVGGELERSGPTGRPGSTGGLDHRPLCGARASKASRSQVAAVDGMVSVVADEDVRRSLRGFLLAVLARVEREKPEAERGGTRT